MTPGQPPQAETLADIAAASLDDWRARGLWRSPSVFATAQRAEASLRDGAHRTDAALFSSSNYLGLAEDPRLADAASAAIRTYGAGSGGSRLTTGTNELHLAAEAACARLTGYDDAVLFATGYQANVSTLQALAAACASAGGLTIVSDARNHASIIDGCRLAKASGAEVRVTPHRDVGAVARALSQRTTAHALVVTDGLFSMDGVCAPLPALLEVCREHGAWSMLDDAHAIGTIGATGRGLPEYFGVRPDIQLMTASKALGAEGAAVATNAPVAQLLCQQARSFVFSTSPAPATCAAITAAVEVLESDPKPVQRLHANIARWYANRGEGAIDPAGAGPIIPVHVGDEAAAMRASAQLLERGFIVPAIRWPTVARGQAILRVTLMATHTSAQIDALCAELAALGIEGYMSE
ncbi:aminotransferase class I/II-fold pyridoxal phosphate-dependent enzyme [Corynebacterium hadale]|uniref:aminotransferase class I/II-fold pyridoxal phosphate-dependent enzyme n=1 Tax=Corynebacterium hadale TaxID=2026255 RepID=UPI000BAA8A8F|nr:8-amino-7-oxononanoate synthase [Corynebacterium hadale]PAT08373.1 8-amino-7-oxononanoate synthase [Corynebacterium hadale]